MSSKQNPHIQRGLVGHYKVIKLFSSSALPEDVLEDTDEAMPISARATRVIESFGEAFVLKKPLDKNLLDDRVLKALKKQEEREGRRAARRKKVARKLIHSAEPQSLPAILTPAHSESDLNFAKFQQAYLL